MDPLVPRGRQVLAHVVGPDRQLAVAAIDEHGQAHRSRPTELGQRVEGRTDRSAGVEDVVDQHDDAVVDPAVGNLGAPGSPDRVAAQVVAMERDVELADRDVGPLDLGDRRSETVRERDSARWDPEENEARGPLVAFEDLVADAAERPGDLVGAEDVPRVGRGARRGWCTQVRAGPSRWTSFPASQDGG